MIKKTTFILFLFISFFLVHAAFAQNTSSGAPAETTMIVGSAYKPQPVTSANFLGQDQYYSVTFRGNGEAVVSTKVIFSNLTESTMSALTFRVPKVQPQDVMVYQVIREAPCLRYRPYPNLTPGPLIYDKVTIQKMSIPSDIYAPSVCEEYQEPDYYQYWYGNNSYEKAQTTIQADSITINLAKPVSPNASGSFILYYRALGYAKKNIFGAYNFTFETLKTEDRIRTLQVGISTDSDLYMRGANGKVDYGQVQQTLAPMATSETQGSFKNAQFDSFLSQIGQGTIIKSANSLQPLDSYTVKGSYAEAKMSLYGKEITIGIIIFFIVLAVIAFIARALYRFFAGRTTLPESGKEKAKPVQQNVSYHPMLRISGEVLALSFVSSVFIGGYTLLLIFTTSFLRSVITYEFDFIFMILLGIISIAVYALFIFGPVVYMGIKRGFWRAVITMCAIIGWLVMYLFIIIMVLALYRTYPTNNYYAPAVGTPIMKSIE